MYPNFRNTVEVGIFYAGKLLVVQRAASANIAPNAWHVPAGKVKYEETPKQAAFREVLEETNLQLRDVEEVFVRPFQGQTTDGETYYRCIFTYVAHVDSIASLQLNDEHSTYAWVEVEELASVPYTSFDSYLQHIFLQAKEKARRK